MIDRKNFNDFLVELGVEKEMVSILSELTGSLIRIYGSLNDGNEGYSDQKNSFGEMQVTMDILSNDILVDTLSKNADVVLIASEELAEPIVKEGFAPGEGFSVVFDPLDGSSVSDANMTVGTIVGIYRGSNLIGMTGRDQVAALMAVYGQKLSFYLAIGRAVEEFIFDEEKGEFVLSASKIEIQASGKIFAPGDLNCMMDEKWYHDALHYWLENGYKLRYSGSMAADMNLILKKGGGVFVYPGSKKNSSGKLRLLYECAPVAMLMENAGGAASNGKESILDIRIDTYEQQEPFMAGSKDEVKRLVDRIRQVC